MYAPCFASSFKFSWGVGVVSFTYTNLKQNIAKSFAQIGFAIPDDSHIFNLTTVFKVAANALLFNGYEQTQILKHQQNAITVMYEQEPQTQMHEQKWLQHGAKQKSNFNA